MPIDYDRSREALFQPAQRPTVLGTGGEPDRVALAVEAARLAYLRAEEGGDALRRLQSDLAGAGFSEPVPFHHPETDSQGFGALRAADGLALLAFRGTEAERLRDLLTDALALRVRWPQVGGQVHQGFAQGAAALWPHAEQWLLRTAAQRRRLLVCGHSLGGAIATLLAVPARADWLVTIGSPRVGDKDFAAAFHRAGIDTTRIVDFQDIVACVPPRWLGYRHIGRGECIDRDGRRGPNPDPAHIDRDPSPEDIAAAAAALLPFVALPRVLSDHAPVNYLRAFWP